MKWIKIIYQFFFTHLRTQISRVQFLMLISTMVGLASGLTAVLLKTLVHYLEQYIESIPVSEYAYLLFPALGLVLTVFIINFFFKGHIEKGIAMVLRSIARRSSYIPLSHTYLHIITSSLTVGLGGSAGLEAPIVATGSALGSNLGRLNALDYRERTLLTACGAASGIAAVFNSPIAGVIFAVEVLLTEATVSYFIPLMMASVVGVLCSKIILQESILFNFRLKEVFDYHNVPFYILLGVAAGFISVYYAHIYKKVEHRFHTSKQNVYKRALMGGLMLLALCFLFPPLFGEGYTSVKLISNGTFNHVEDHTTLFNRLGDTWSLIVFAGFIMFLKPIAAGITIGAGGNGGNFAPSLFVGSYLGFFMSKLLNTTGWLKIPEGNFSLVGMAGVLSGVMYCPLTAIFLIAEITNGYELFIPLMIVSSLSYFIVKHYSPYSMETTQLAQQGQIFTHRKEQNILATINLEEIIQDKYFSIFIDKKLKDLIELITQSEKNIFAVHDAKEKFAGIIELNDIKKELFQPSKFDTLTIRQIMKKPPDVIYKDEKMLEVMDKFDISHSWYLPVLTRDKKFLGFVSKSKIFEKYREMLASQSDLYEDTPHFDS